MGIDSSNGAIRPGQVLPGSYQAQLTLWTATCSETFPASNSVFVKPPPNPNFSYPNNDSICINVGNPLPSTFSPGGSFRVLSGGCVVDSGTGEILLGQSSPGNCEIVHEFPVDCPVSDTLVVTIRAADVSTFSYALDTFCTSDRDTIFPDLPLNFTAGGNFLASPSGIQLLSNADGSFSPHLATAGTYTISYNSIASGTSNCPTSTSVVVEISDGVSPIFAYPESIVCDNYGQLEVDVDSLPTQLGAFFVHGGGLDLNATTGAINTLNSSEGEYEVIFIPSAPEFCPDSIRAIVSIEAQDTFTSIDYTPGLNLPEDTFCILDGTLVPEWLGDSAGTFSVQPALVWEDISKGEINLDETSAGTYTISYELGGVCEEKWTEQIVVLEREDPSFGYEEPMYCPNGDNPVPVNIVSPGGLYRSGTIGVDSLTGEIDLVSGPNRLHEIEYVTPGYCYDSTIVIVDVLDIVPDLNWEELDSYTICEGDPVEIKVNFPVHVEFWKNQEQLDTMVTDYVYTGLENGDTIRLRYSADKICYEEDSFRMEVLVTPIIELGKATRIEVNDSDLEFELVGNIEEMQVRWTSELQRGAGIVPDMGIVDFAGNKEQVFEALVSSTLINYPTSLQLYLTPENQICPGKTDTIDVLINPGDLAIFIPELVTPNDDDFNRYWKVQWTDNINPQDYQIALFNRSYGKVIEGDLEKFEEWDPNTMNIADGVYRWILREADGKVVRTGGLTIRRN